MLTFESYFTERGIEQGIREGKINDAKKMLEFAAEIEFIKNVTGLNIEEIEKLRSKN